MTDYLIQGKTKDSVGNPFGDCTLLLFRTSDEEFIDITVSDENGNYVFHVTDTSTQYFVISYKTMPDVYHTVVFGTTDRNLVGT